MAGRAARGAKLVAQQLKVCLDPLHKDLGESASTRLTLRRVRLWHRDVPVLVHTVMLHILHAQRRREEGRGEDKDNESIDAPSLRPVTSHSLGIFTECLCVVECLLGGPMASQDSEKTPTLRMASNTGRVSGGHVYVVGWNVAAEVAPAASSSTGAYMEQDTTEIIRHAA